MRWTAKYWSWYKKKKTVNLIPNQVSSYHDYCYCNGKAVMSALAVAVMSMGIFFFKAMRNFESSMKQVDNMLKDKIK